VRDLITGTTVYVTHDNVERALRKFKRKVTDSKRLVDLKEKEFYTKPTTRRKLKKAQAKSRWKRYLETSKQFVS
jgi:ribosomal protein S21